MDQLDRAELEEQRQRDNAITAHKNRGKTFSQCFDDKGRVVCCKCNERISRARQKALPHVTLCTICKTESEKIK